MKTIYITGCNGFIGNRLFQYFSRITNYEVIGIDLGVNKIVGNIVYSDFANVSFLKNIIRENSYVIHTAAFIPEAGTDHINTENINTKILKFTIEVFKNKRIERFFNTSTISIYGYGQKELTNVKENDEIILANPYAKAKYKNEILLSETFSNNYNLRISSPFGKGKRRRTYLDMVVEKILKNEEVIIYGEGKRRQDYIWVEDIARVIEEMLRENTLPGNYNLGAGTSYDAKGVINIIGNATKRKAKIRSINEREAYSVSICNNKLLAGIEKDKSFFTSFEKAVMELL